MKELDLTKATVLKWLLKHGGGYSNYDIHYRCQDICTLLRMTLFSLVKGFKDILVITLMIGFFGAAFCAVLWVVVMMFSFLTLYLPDSWQFVDPSGMLAGLIMLGIVCFALVLLGVKETLVGDMKFAPEYMKRPLRKLFRKGNTCEEKSPAKVKESSPTMAAIKEMYLSFKNKTCIKVKL